MLVCDVCLTRWELNTLLAIRRGCFDYPLPGVPAEVRGDTVLVPAAGLEARVPRAYHSEDVVDEDVGPAPSAD